MSERGEESCASAAAARALLACGEDFRRRREEPRVKLGVVGLELEKVLFVVVTLGDVTKPSKRDMESVACGTTSCSSERVGEREEGKARVEREGVAEEEEAAKCGEDLEEEEGEGEERGAFGLGDARALPTSAASRTRGLACGLTRGEVLDKVDRGRGGLFEDRTFMRYT